MDGSPLNFVKMFPVIVGGEAVQDTQEEGTVGRVGGHVVAETRVCGRVTVASWGLATERDIYSAWFGRGA